MTFKDSLEADMAVFFNAEEFAETIVYNGVEIVAVVDVGGTPAEAEESLRDEALIYVKASDVTAPAYGDAVTARGHEWKVRRVPDAHDGFIWTISVIKNTRPQLKR